MRHFWAGGLSGREFRIDVEVINWRWCLYTARLRNNAAIFCAPCVFFFRGISSLSVSFFKIKGVPFFFSSSWRYKHLARLPSSLLPARLSGLLIMVKLAPLTRNDAPQPASRQMHIYFLQGAHLSGPNGLCRTPGNRQRHPVTVVERARWRLFPSVVITKFQQVLILRRINSAQLLFSVAQEEEGEEEKATPTFHPQRIVGTNGALPSGRIIRTCGFRHLTSLHPVFLGISLRWNVRSRYIRG